jgi:transcriptional regulator of arginine metabolism
MDKEDRQARILRLIHQRSVRTQADLTRQLTGAGCEVDQSTLSRDLAELSVRKVGGVYRVIDADEETVENEIDYAFAVHWFTPCGPNLIVLTTEVGQAQPIALWIDRKAEPAILATLAGDDTIYLTTRTRRTQTVALRRLKQWFGEKQR